MKPGQPSRGSGLSDEVIGRLLAVMAAYPEIRRVILFGSRAKGNCRPASDIDLCLDAPGLTLKQQLEIETLLDDLLLPWKIDLVLLHEIDNPALLDHIQRAGIHLKD